MKKSILLLTLLLATASFLTAQKASINIKGGVNGIYNVGTTDIKEAANTFFGGDPGYQIGAEFQTNLATILGFRGEVNYVNGKFTYEQEKNTNTVPNFNSNGNNFRVTEVMNVVNQGIQIPTSLTFDLGLIDINAGPNFEFLLSSVASGSLSAINLDSVSQNIPTQDIDYDFLNDLAGQGAYFDQNIKDGNLFNSFNVGINLGAGINLGKLRVDIKTNYVITDAINDYYQSSQGESVDRPISFQLSAVYRLFDFDLKRKKNKDDEDDEEEED